MTIALSKFGTTLTSRQAGREAFAAFRPSLPEVSTDQIITIDFTGVITFSPSWGDEFLKPLHEMYGANLLLANTENPSVKATLQILEEVHGFTFNK